MKVTADAARRALVLEGDLDAAGGREVEPHLGRLLDALGEGDEPVVLDLAGVEYMDSSGFSAWVALERRVRARGRALLVAGARPLIRDLFVFADLEEVLVP